MTISKQYWMNILSTPKLFNSAHLKNPSKLRSSNGITNWKQFPMWWRNGWNVKDNGCIYNLFSIQEIFLNNFQLKVRNLDQLIMFGKQIWHSLNSTWMWRLSVALWGFWINLNKPMINWNKFRNLWMSILKRKEKNSLDFISYLMTIFWKFSHKLNNLQQCNLT